MMKNIQMFYVKLFMSVFLMLGALFSAENALADGVTKHDAKQQIVVIETSEGKIVIALDTNVPETTENFLKYARAGFYNGTIFHRVIDGFMIQGGGFLPDMKEKAPLFAPIKNEAKHGEKNTRGSVAMARTSDPNSATSQFFINTDNNDFLNFTSETPQGWGYCVFAHVIHGMDVVDKIKRQPTTTLGVYQNVPTHPVIIKKVIVEKQ